MTRDYNPSHKVSDCGGTDPRLVIVCNSERLVGIQLCVSHSQMCELFSQQLEKFGPVSSFDKQTKDQSTILQNRYSRMLFSQSH